MFNEFLSDLGDYLDPECGVQLVRKLLFYFILTFRERFAKTIELFI